MSSFLQSLLACLTGGSNSPKEEEFKHFPKCYRGYVAVPSMEYYPSTNAEEKLHLSTQQTAEDIVEAFRTATTSGPALDHKVSNLVSATGAGWTEGLAKAVLAKLSDALKGGASGNWGEAMKVAYERSTTAAWEFAREHPVYLTLIALGVLVILAPWALEALGFGALGPVEGSFAAWWQSTYCGYVRKDSLFAFLQRLGMKWGRKVASATVGARG